MLDGNQTQNELMSPASESGFEEVSRVSATLYLEMKRCIDKGNLKAFREAVTVFKQIVKKGDIPKGSRTVLLKSLSAQTDPEGRNLLHYAAAYAVANDDSRFFVNLL